LAVSEVEELRAEVERLRANGLDWMKRYEAAVEHERAAEAEVERLREQVKQLQYDLLLGPKPAEVTPLTPEQIAERWPRLAAGKAQRQPAEHVIDVDMTGLNGDAL
jgi:predicted  nucleic acid-binding Zn-ribbon protein